MSGEAELRKDYCTLSTRGGRQSPEDKRLGRLTALARLRQLVWSGNPKQLGSLPILLGLLFRLLLIHSATAQLSPDPPTFTVLLGDGTTHQGPLGKIAEDWSMRLAGEKPVLLPAGDIVQARRRDQGPGLPPPPGGMQVVLGTGDRLPLRTGSKPRLAGERLTVELTPPLRAGKLESMTLPLGVVALIWLDNPEPGQAVEMGLRRLLQTRRLRDLLILRNGDRLEGTVIAVEAAAGCTIEVQRRNRTVPLEQVAVIAFSTPTLITAPPKKLHAQVVLNGGARLTLLSAQVNDNGRTLVGKTPFGGKVEMPLAQVVGLTWRKGCAVYLSELTPINYKQQPFLGVGRPLVRDGSVLGDCLRIGGQTFDLGLGLQSGSRVSYALDGKYSRFQSEVGLDSRSGQLGRVHVQVLLDGTPQELLPAGRELTGKDIVRVDLPVQGVQRLTLVVEPGSTGAIQGHVNWGDARLIRRQ